MLFRSGEQTFDNFVVELRESAVPSTAMGRVLPGDARSSVMTGLKGSTGYNIKLYASSGGRNTKSLFAVATTGTGEHVFCSRLFEFSTPEFAYCTPSTTVILK